MANAADNQPFPVLPIDSRDRRYLRAVIDAIPHFIFARDTEGRFTLVNKAVADFYGKRVEDIEGRFLGEIHPDPAQAEQWLAEDRRTLELGKQWTLPEAATSSADGRDIWISAVKKPLRADVAGIDQVLGVSIDQTDRHRAEAHVAHRLEYEHTIGAMFQAFIHCTPGGLDNVMKRALESAVVYSGATRAFVYRFDEAATEARLCYDWRAQNSTASNLPVTCSDTDLAWLLGLFDMKMPVMVSALSAADTIPGVFRERWGRDAEAFVAAPILHKGKLFGFLGMDRTEAHEWTQEEINLLHSIADLYITVWSKHETELSLKRAMEEARASDEAKSLFLANMSHEIRTPMNCIIGLADLLTEMEPTPRQAQYLDMIRLSGASLLTLINDILDLSKIEAGHLEMDPVPTDLRDVVSEVAGLSAFKAQSKGLELVCRLAPGVPRRALTDAGRLRQVLTNLLSNAVKFTERGHVYLDIEPVGVEGDSMQLRFAVTDTGIGIAPESQARIFEKFTQAEAGTTRRFGGTGLGLSISQEIVGMMGGRIEVISHPGAGSAFSFTVPVTVLEAHEAPLVDEPAHVLVVTDHQLAGEVLGEQLRTLGHDVRVLYGGTDKLDEAAGWASAEQRPFTHLLYSQSASGDDVPDLTDHLQRLAPKHTPRVVLLTNMPSLVQDRELRAKGYHGTLTKPVADERLTALLSGTEQPSLEPSAEPARNADAFPATEMALPDGPRVLLAEDNPFNQRVAMAMLKLLNCRVDVADNGAAAVAMVSDGSYDLVLMDCQMPEMDGYEATRRIRALPGDAAAVTIIAMTANALSGDRSACFTAGMDDFLSKPITKDVLAQTLQKWEIVSAEPAGVS